MISYLIDDSNDYSIFSKSRDRKKKLMKTSIDKRNKIDQNSSLVLHKNSNETINETLQLEDELKRQRKINRKSISTIHNLQEQLHRVKQESIVKLKEYNEKVDNVVLTPEGSIVTYGSRDFHEDKCEDRRDSNKPILIKAEDNISIGLNDQSSTKSTKDSSSLLFVHKLTIKEKELKEAKEEIKKLKEDKDKQQYQEWKLKIALNESKDEINKYKTKEK